MNDPDPRSLRGTLAETFVFEEAAGAGEPSIAALTQEAEMIRRAFPDIEYRAVRRTQSAGRSLVEFRAIGVHEQDFLGVPATASLAMFSGVFNLKIEGMRVSRLRLTIDFGGLRRQLLLASHVAKC